MERKDWFEFVEKKLGHYVQISFDDNIIVRGYLNSTRSIYDFDPDGVKHSFIFGFKHIEEVD